MATEFVGDRTRNARFSNVLEDGHRFGRWPHLVPFTSVGPGVRVVGTSDQLHRNPHQSLLDLLTFLKLHYDNIVLVDDGEANITSRRQALPAAGINYYGFHYKGVDKSFDDADKDQARAAWGSWSELMEKRYPNRWVRWGERDGVGCGR